MTKMSSPSDGLLPFEPGIGHTNPLLALMCISEDEGTPTDRRGMAGRRLEPACMASPRVSILSLIEERIRT
jgi:hypothetical protein